MRTCDQKRKKRHVAIAQKLDLVEQNQCDFWIQCIGFVLNQLKKTQTTNLLLTCVIIRIRISRRKLVIRNGINSVGYVKTEMRQLIT